MAIRWILQFSKPADESEFMLLTALQQLTKLEVVEQSTVYKNPQAQFNLATAVLQALGPYIQVGLVNPRPLIEDLLIAAGKRNVNRYFGLPAPQGPQQAGAPGQPQPGQPGMPPQSAEGAGGTVPAGPPAAPPMQGPQRGM
jgi:hypothetical protein